MAVVNDYEVADYQRAFVDAGSPLDLEHIATEWAELPEPVQEAILSTPERDEMYVFYFSRYIPELDGSVCSWFPFKKMDLEGFTPDEIASFLTPLLTEAAEHEIQGQREAVSEHREDDDDTSAHNPE